MLRQGRARDETAEQAESAPEGDGFGFARSPAAAVQSELRNPARRAPGDPGALYFFRPRSFVRVEPDLSLSCWRCWSGGGNRLGRSLSGRAAGDSRSEEEEKKPLEVELQEELEVENGGKSGRRGRVTVAVGLRSMEARGTRKSDAP